VGSISPSAGKYLRQIGAMSGMPIRSGVSMSLVSLSAARGTGS
jgi:hypothetical protein